MYKYENLNQSNRLAYLWNRCKAGLRSIPESPARSALTALYWFTALLLLLHAAGPADGITSEKQSRKKMQKVVK
jgi:hypothetical protein